MTRTSGKNYHASSSRPRTLLFSAGSNRLRLLFKALLAIFITEIILMGVLTLLPPMPTIVIALLDALLLVIIISLLFWPLLKNEMIFQDERFNEAQETLRKSEERYRALVESTEDSIYLVNRLYCYLFMNQNHLARLGFSADDFLDKPYSDFHSQEETQKFEAAVDEIFATGKSIQQEHQSIRDGRYFLRTMSPVKTDAGTVTAVTVISKQITARKEMEEELRLLSLTDELTGLYNRRGFMTLAAQQIKIAKRLNSMLLLISTDLDDLKVINDTYGHQEGDQALIDVSTILMNTFRSSDIVARIGGDEFVALQIKNVDNSLSISTDRLKDKLAEHNKLSGRAYTISLSLGTEVFDPDQPRSLEELLADADAKMYEQKKMKKTAKFNS